MTSLHTPSPHELQIGLDEAGRGCWAGPVVAGAVWFHTSPETWPKSLHLLNDSKKLSESARLSLFPLIQQHAFWGIGQASAQEIDELNILQASFLAMARARDQLFEQVTQTLSKDHQQDLGWTNAADWVNQSGTFLIDGNRVPHWSFHHFQERFEIKGDGRWTPIAAASILAKVARDQMMMDLDQHYPQYGFSQHKSYGTLQHRQALAKHGPCPEHRLSYKPIQALITHQGA